MRQAIALAEKLNEIGFTHNRIPGEVAIAWTLHNPAVTGAIVGARRPEQIENLVGAAEFRLSDVELSELNEFLSEISLSSSSLKNAYEADYQMQNFVSKISKFLFLSQKYQHN